MEFTKHFKAMLEERQIKNEWVDDAIRYPDQIEDREDGTRHYLKKIQNYENRWLRVVTNHFTEPQKAVTVFLTEE
jgi:hypothetical protein